MQYDVKYFIMYQDTNLKNEFLTREQVAELLHCSKMTVLRWTQQGKLHSFGIGRRPLYDKKEVMAVVTGTKSLSK
jgi:excisionase family DNA binding protein|tara:strand:- start:44 stop:268 length:225 start_codon:yes stop_codon:yes gene_type:complete